VHPAVERRKVMDFGKLSETFRGLAGHLESLVGTGVGIATTGVKLEQGAIGITMMMQKILEGFAAALEGSPWTVPGPQIPPAAK